VSVVSGRRTIFCEGKQSSLDYELLSRVVEGISGDQCTIVPRGGKFSSAIFAQGYFVSIQVWGLTEGKKSAVGIRETTVSKGWWTEAKA
jgi:hypothetical protein